MVDHLKEDYLWTEKYRPHTISELILPENLKKTFQTFVDQGNIPNLLLTGKPGLGKTSAAKAMCDELQSEYIVINGSKDRNIDTLRNDIQSFASAVSLDGGRKYVILDEADYTNPNSFQPALRNFMEEYSRNTGFILTCNFKNKIIEPLHSRCSVIEFNINNNEKGKLAVQFMKRLCHILDVENISYTKEVLAEIIKKFKLDWRRILNECQRYSANGPIDSGMLTNFTEFNISQLIEFMKQKDFTNVRKWVGENSDIDTTDFFRKLYDMSATIMTQNSIPMLVLILARYQYQSNFVTDQQINTAACLVEIMSEAEWR